MRGEICVGFASILSCAALLMLIVAQVGQISISNVPQQVYLASVNVSQYGDSLQNATFDTVQGLYTSNDSAPLLAAAGLRQFYRFGFYSYCAYVNSSAGTCSNHTFGSLFTPYDDITGDMAPNYTEITATLLSDRTTFADSSYLSQLSKAAFWMIFLGTITAGLAFLTGLANLAKNSCTFFVSTVFSIASSILVLMGAVIWTIVVKKSSDVNGLLIGANAVPLGITVSLGPGILLIWAAFACMFASVIPYMVTCCTFRG